MNIFIIFSITFAYVFLGNGLSNANPLPYEAIFNFGDSISDTGNAATNHPAMPSNSPYGSTYFKHPSGRLANRRLILDFIAVLATVNIDKEGDYGQFGCLTTYNAFIEYYNEQLKKAIETLRQQNPNVKITYFDYYGAAKRLFQAPQQYGFSSGKLETFKACCGKGEPYGLSAQFPCGSFFATVCSDPSKHINWDGPHFTEATYRLITKGLVEGPFANPSMKSPPFKII
ncbi:hypothetical protein Fmac_011658 [Flemingia macrophylla]|uniref:Uncharacterized protein n=1 Tax=Flemingia macrophylla TaxID=520843 RepID=A0ABD1MN32_9FABA